MSTTTVCRGLQSRLEAQTVEPLTLRMTLAPRALSSINPDSNVSTEKKPANGEFGGWSFLESLVKDVEAAPYVHPLDKSSSSTLSNKSLDLCTESLGCETGSDIGDESDVYSSSSSDSERSTRSPTRERSRLFHSAHKKATPRSFPPPLTSISGSDYVQYTPHREGGRLVIRAVKITNSPTCFQAERVNGRLRLRFKECYDSSSCSEADTDEEDEEKEHQEQEQDENDCLNEKETAIVKNQRPCSWYKESEHANERFLNWKPFLGVAI